MPIQESEAFVDLAPLGKGGERRGEKKKNSPLLFPRERGKNSAVFLSNSGKRREKKVGDGIFPRRGGGKEKREGERIYNYNLICWASCKKKRKENTGLRPPGPSSQTFAVKRGGGEQRVSFI